MRRWRCGFASSVLTANTGAAARRPSEAADTKRADRRGRWVETIAKKLLKIGLVKGWERDP